MTTNTEIIFERPDQHHAFKKGYRLALQKQPIFNMPSYIRRDDELRHFFEQGWFQAQEEIQAGIALNRNPNLRYRATWIIMTALAGAATAALIIKESNSFSLSDLDNLLQRVPATQAPLTASPLAQPPIASVIMDNDELTLLSASERQGLSALHQTDTELNEPISRQPLVANPATINAQLSAHTDPEQLFSSGSNIPKFVRQLRFTAHATELNTDAVILRWLWQNRIMQTQNVEIKQNSFKILSEQSLYSAWQGDWDIEILDQQQNVIYRYSFIYGHE